MMHRFGDLVVWPTITSLARRIRFSRLIAHNIPMPDRKRKRKPTVSIIGSGRLGTTLAVSLAGRGYPIRSLVARRLQNARKAANLLDAEVQVLAAKQMISLQPANVFLITVPDDQIAGAGSELSRLSFTATALHTSGALSSEVLAPLQKKGWPTGSVHPLMSVSDASEGDTALRGGFWSIEGDKNA